MTGTTISASTTIGVVLTTFDQNPLTITSTGAIATSGTSAVYGSPLTAWVIANAGHLAAAVDGAVSLLGGGAVVNGDAANTTASMVGAAYGIFVAGSDASVGNFGTISGTGPFGVGIDLFHGGTVTNGTEGDSAALVLSVGDGIDIGISANPGFRTGSLVNLGTVESTGSAGAAVQIGAGSVLNGSTSDVTASILSSLEAINIADPGGVVANYGTIVSSGTAASRNAGVGIQLLSGGTVFNGSNADTAAYLTATRYGVLVSGTLAGSVVNFGRIVAPGNVTGSGIYLSAGGTVSNGSAADTTASIAGYQRGIWSRSLTVGSVINFGSIVATGTASGNVGIKFDSSGKLTNGSVTDAAAKIIGYHGVEIGLGSSDNAVQNFGTIAGIRNAALVVVGGGTISNGAVGDTSALITVSTGEGVYFGGPGTLSNYARIEAAGTGSLGVVLGARGATALTNGSGTDQTATISGDSYGVQLLASGDSLTNFATIASPLGDGAFQHVAQMNATGIFINGNTGDTSAVIIGAANGIRVTSVYEAVLVPNIATISNFGTIAGLIGINFYAFSSSNTSGYGTVINAGTIASTAGTSGTALRFGQGEERLIIDPGAAFIGNVIGGYQSSGSMSFSTSLELRTGTSSGTLSGLGTQFSHFGTILFDPGAAWHIAGDAAGLANGQTIVGLSQGDTIELVGLNESIHSYSAGLLSLIGDQSLTLHLPGTFTTDSFLATAGADGTDITLACFAAGTRISTPDGPVPVEALLVDDVVLTYRGEASIIWLGCRRINCRSHPDPKSVWPVRIAANAFAIGRPSRDLWLSPDHAILIDQVLIPIKYLINGITIAQIPVAETTYYHIELPRHDVLLAEDLPAESYLDTDDRPNFADAAEVLRLYPDFSAHAGKAMTLWEARGYAPLVISGALLDAARLALAARATNGRRPRLRPSQRMPCLTAA